MQGVLPGRHTIYKNLCGRNLYGYAKLESILHHLDFKHPLSFKPVTIEVGMDAWIQSASTLNSNFPKTIFAKVMKGA